MNTYISARSTSNDKFLTHTLFDAAFFSFLVAGVSGCKIQEIKKIISLIYILHCNKRGYWSITTLFSAEAASNISISLTSFAQLNYNQ